MPKYVVDISLVTSLVFANEGASQKQYLKLKMIRVFLSNFFKIPL